MLSYKWLLHKGKRILYMDIGTDNPEELKKITSQIELDIEKEPPKSTICICNVKDITIRLRPEIIQILKDFTKHNEPYMKMTAVIGVEGLRLIFFNSILVFTRRKNLILKNTEEEALEWLMEQ
jgi:hypothetical protein